MLKDYLQTNTLSIVLLGDFNPAIIQPYWLAAKKLIRDVDSRDAEVKVIHKQLTRFDLELCTIEVTDSRFEVRTSKEPNFEPMIDLLSAIFTILKDTPIKAVGINHLYTYQLPNAESYYQFGNKLAPLSNWNSFLNDPRLLQLEIYENERPDGLNGHYRIIIQPADRTLVADRSVAINFNNHIQLKQGQDGRNGEVIKLLTEHYSQSVERSNSIVEKIWEKVTS